MWLAMIKFVEDSGQFLYKYLNWGGEKERKKKKVWNKLAKFLKTIQINKLKKKL